MKAIDQSSYSKRYWNESNSDDGYGEGQADVEKGLEPIINNEETRQALSLILGGLSSYTCDDLMIRLLWAQVWAAKQGGTGRLKTKRLKTKD